MGHSILIGCAQRLKRLLRVAAVFLLLPALAGHVGNPGLAWGADNPPVPLLLSGHAVDWWFVFKFNAHDFPGCGEAANEALSCPFDADAQHRTSQFSQRFVFASKENPKLQEGSGCVGNTDGDPLGATFAQIFSGAYHYVVWNDQSYTHPQIAGCTNACLAPWGHSKGLIAWNDDGEGVVLQVTTPSWPESASAEHPRDGDANSLGCVADNNVKLSQHFFALRLTKQDVVAVLMALSNASVVTKPADPSVFSNGGPEEIKNVAATLGHKSPSHQVQTYNLSSGVLLISKPSKLNVPPWQMVSSVLGGVPLKAATFWNNSDIPDTRRRVPDCWDDSLTASPGPVKIVHNGSWNGQTFSLESGYNHAKVGVATDQEHPYSIFGDMNQEGTLAPINGKCNKRQNGRGGLFFVVDDQELHDGIDALLSGQ